MGIAGGARNTPGVPFDDTLQDFVLVCLGRVEQLVTELERLDADSGAQRQCARIREDIRRELQAAEDAIRTFVVTDAE